MRHIFIINPHAGKQDQTAPRSMTWRTACAAQHGLDVPVPADPDAPAAPRRWPGGLAETGEALRLYACGGDGTVNEVANGIAGFRQRRHDLHPHRHRQRLSEEFRPGRRQNSQTRKTCGTAPDGPLDLIDCNGRQCLTIACSGIDARVADSVH